MAPCFSDDEIFYRHEECKSARSATTTQNDEAVLRILLNIKKTH